MAYCEKLAKRVRRILDDCDDVREQKMFGGLAFMIRGYMCCAVSDDDLMLRVGRDQYDAMLKRRHVREMDVTGQPMRGYIFVESNGQKGRALRSWVSRGLAVVESLPDKKFKPKKRSSMGRFGRPRR